MVVLVGSFAGLVLATPSATAASNEEHGSCVAALTSYFKVFGMTGEVGPLFSSMARENQPFGQSTISDLAGAKGVCD